MNPLQIVCLLISLTQLSTIADAQKRKKDPFGDIPEEEKWMVTKTCWFDIEIDEESAGRIEIGLFGEVAPITVNNFAALCRGNYNGEIGFGYRGTNFHRIVKDFTIQGGDITAGDGTGGRSIYGDHFNDEPFIHKHAGPGYVSMANKGRPDTNGSQFFISLHRFRWLDNFHTVFGKVLQGMDLVSEISELPTEEGTDRPVKEVRIVNCGLTRHDPYVLEESKRDIIPLEV